MPELFTKVPVMLIVFGLLLLLPVKIQPHQLKALAFSLWLVGGCMLSYFGFMRLLDPAGLEAAGASISTALIAGIIGLLIGFGKGRFVLAKTSNRNIERLDAITEPMRPVHVYSKRSWIVIGVMVLIALSINLGWISMPLFIRGAINLAIGFALIISSLNYLNKKPQANGSKA